MLNEGEKDKFNGVGGTMVKLSVGPNGDGFREHMVGDTNMALTMMGHAIYAIKKLSSKGFPKIMANVFKGMLSAEDEEHSEADKEFIEAMIALFEHMGGGGDGEAEEG